ncbi:hypothetical protein JOD54_006173 [Actinokineospora baliensis]|uniref:LamG-like jellyroll fold domain-containing protein n=1 Tax=Actinokineospora baliensis TaxID=547056 RepID=UPI00195D324B|nr:LamG-like jellyroll fold domain-containing protein [Actinokineospora baliensis]MBM7775969.1 hypothetical protein [Actinokineospora baliensis]
MPGTLLLAAVVGVVGLAIPAQAAAPAPSAPAAAPTAAEDSALQRARATGKPVEVAERTTESTQVIARPDGKFVLESSAAPQRVKRDGKWLTVDATVRTTPEGTLSPVATPLDVAFSAGGTAPYVTLKSPHGDGQVALTWPSPLPTPKVDGPSVTYPAVFPGVDLVLTASDLGYSQVLVVHDAAAAANPALREIKVTSRTTGLTLTSGADGALSAVDGTGKPVFRGSTPTQWDSSQPAGHAKPSAQDPEGGRVQRVDVAVTKATEQQGRVAGKAAKVETGEVSVRPDIAALTKPDVKYPVYVDPSMTGNQLAWGETTQNGWNYFNANMDAQVGRCYNGNNQCGALTVARSYFRFNTSELAPRAGWPAVVWKAQVATTQTHGAHLCVAEPVQIRRTGVFTGSLSWNNPAVEGVLDTRSSGAGDQCGGAGGVLFESNDLKDYLQAASIGSWPDIHMALTAPNEAEQLQWKKFATSGAAAPKVVVEFSFRPNQPTGLAVPSAYLCSSTATTGTATPTLTATATDNNNPTLPIVLRYEVFNSNGIQVANSGNDVQIASGTTGAWTTPPLGDGVYRFQVGAIGQYPGDPSRYLWGPAYSTSYYFIVRTTPIPALPTIRSVDYPAQNWGAAANNPGSFILSDPTNPDVLGFSYSFTGPGTQTIPGPVDCEIDRQFGTTGGWVSGKTNVPIRVPSGLSPGYHTLHARSFDSARKFSPEQSYQFYVAPPTPVASTRIEAESMAFSQPGGQNVPVTNQVSCCWVTWSGGAHVHFQGTAVNQQFSLAFTVATERDYELGLGVTRSMDYGQTQFSIDGVAVGQPTDAGPVGSFDHYDPVVRTRQLSLGTRRLTAGTHTLTVKLTGANAGAVGDRFHAGIDFLQLNPTGRFEAEQANQVTPTQPAGQSMTVVAQNQAGGTASWSEGAQLAFDATADNASVELAVKIAQEADYALGVNLTKGPQQAKVAVSVNDVPLANTDTAAWDGYQAAVGTAYLPLGGVHLTAGTHKVKFKVSGRNASATGWKIGVDYLTAAAIGAATAADFASAMNNNGIAPEGTGSDLDGSGAKGISAQTMAAAGLAPGASLTVDGATFVMPAHRPDGNDNVVAYGQTIPLPAAQQVKASAIGLLVVNTCYSSPQRAGGVNYLDNTTDRPQFPPVPDWFMGSRDTAQVVLPHFTLGTATSTAGQPRLFTIFVPADPTKVVKSVTLPNYGTTFMPGCVGAPAMHVLAMAPRPVATGWLGAWSAPADTITTPPGGAGLANQTVRTVVHPTTTGSQVRVTLSNALNPNPVTVTKASVGAQKGTGVEALATPAALTFGGTAAVTIPAGGEVISDAVSFPATAGGTGNLVVSVHHASAVSTIPVHANATAPVRFGAGDLTAATSPTGFTTAANGTYLVSSVQVSTADTSAGTVVVLGDQYAAAAGPDATAGHRNTWVDRLPGALNSVGVPLPGSIVNTSRTGLPETAAWKMTEPSGTTLLDSAGSSPATLAGGYTRTTARGGAVDFNGTTGYAATSGAVLNTARGYTVSAWVNLESTSTTATVVAQGGTATGSMLLQYSQPANAWALTGPGSDTAGAALATVVGPAPTLNTWTHLVGTYDSATRLLSLYVNGQAVGTPVVSTATWTGTGPLSIGALKLSGGTVSNYFNGSITDVHAFQGSSTPVDAQVLYRGDSTAGPRTGVGSASLTNAADTLHRHAYGEPNLRTVVVALGANDVLAGRSKDDILASFRSVMHQANASALRNTRRTDGSLVHVIVATIPALGLPAADPREIVRQQVNDALVNNYTDQGADEIVDIAAAVADPTNSHQINPSHLTSGTFNETYFTTVANAISLAASTFPPTAQF